MFIVLLIFLLAAIYHVINAVIYSKTSYKDVTHNSYLSVMFNKGRRGEYDIFRRLKIYEKQGCRFLFNIYLPMANGKTTELDALMISPYGVFVIESKNYSGWIFGNDNNKSWTQVLPTGRGKSHKEHFYNPIWQNRTHCNTLINYLPSNAVIKSVVLFSNKCTFKDVTVNSKDVVLAHNREVKTIVARYLSENTTANLDVNNVYETLYPFSQVSEAVKQSHIDNIQARRS